MISLPILEAFKILHQKNLDDAQITGSSFGKKITEHMLIAGAHIGARLNFNEEEQPVNEPSTNSGRARKGSVEGLPKVSIRALRMLGRAENNKLDRQATQTLE